MWLCKISCGRMGWAWDLSRWIKKWKWEVLVNKEEMSGGDLILGIIFPPQTLWRITDELNWPDLSMAMYFNFLVLIFFQEHSAYVEIAEILAEKDPLGAVDVYSKLPISEKPTFDDAFVCGEIVRLLFKVEKYDDSRLLPNMITLGKVMGVGRHSCHR